MQDAPRDAGASGADVTAVSATSMREGAVIYDRAGREIWACPNVDSRSAAEAEDSVLLPEPLIDPETRLRTLCHVTPGEWMLEGIGFYCGMSMRWLRDAFCDTEVAQGLAKGTGLGGHWRPAARSPARTCPRAGEGAGAGVGIGVDRPAR